MSILFGIIGVMAMVFAVGSVEASSFLFGFMSMGVAILSFIMCLYYSVK